MLGNASNNRFFSVFGTRPKEPRPNLTEWSLVQKNLHDIPRILWCFISHLCVGVVRCKRFPYLVNFWTRDSSDDKQHEQWMVVWTRLAHIHEQTESIIKQIMVTKKWTIPVFQEALRGEDTKGEDEPARGQGYPPQAEAQPHLGNRRANQVI